MKDLQIEKITSIALYRSSLRIKIGDECIEHIEATSQVNETKCEQSVYWQAQRFAKSAKRHLNGEEVYFFSKRQKEQIDRLLTIEKCDEILAKIEPLIIPDDKKEKAIIL